MPDAVDLAAKLALVTERVVNTGDAGGPLTAGYDDSLLG